MGTYSPPVDRLVSLGETDRRVERTDYAALGIRPEHVPDLIRLLNDRELLFAEEPGCYAQVHAWRALGQLRAPEAVEPLLDLIASQEVDANWSDWITEDVPRVLGEFGPPIIPAVVARLDRRGRQEWVPIYFAQVLVEIAKREPAARAEVIAQLCRVLATDRDNDPGVNGGVIGDLLDLKAVEAWPAIEAAFSGGHVDLSVAGDAAKAKWELGLGPNPLQKPAAAARLRSGLTPKQRADERKRQRKAEKKRKHR